MDENLHGEIRKNGLSDFTICIRNFFKNTVGKTKHITNRFFIA